MQEVYTTYFIVPAKDVPFALYGYLAVVYDAAQPMEVLQFNSLLIRPDPLQPHMCILWFHPVIIPDYQCMKLFNEM